MATDSTKPDLHLEMVSQPRLLAAARTMVGTVAQRLGFDELECGQISLAVDEALCNIIKHGYAGRDDGRIWVSIWCMDGPLGLHILIEDEAEQIDPESIRSRDLDDIRPGGLGVYIIREVMDDVVYERRDGSTGMRLRLRKHLPSESEAMTRSESTS